MFDYSNVTPTDFESIAQEYLQSTYQGSSWVLTKSIGDGNRDIELSYQFLDQSFEYWAEAKFTKSLMAHKLQKGQLDPTLVSAMLYDKPVSIKFISNNLAPENYFYRLADFRIKTNIGVTMVLKDEFEQWLQQNPEVCQRYGIIRTKLQENEHSPKIHKITIDGALITNEIDLNGYTLERKLVQGSTYFLYLLIYADEPSDGMSLQFQASGFRFLSDSTVLNNPEAFSLHQGAYGYKFRFLAEEQFSGDLHVSLWKDSRLIHKIGIPEVSVLPSVSYSIAYAQQSRIEAEILELARTAGAANKAAVISGKGAYGKSYLAQNLYRELSRRYEALYLSFSDNELYNCSQLYLLLLYLNIGDIRGCSLPAIKAAVSQFACAEKKRFLMELVERGGTAPEKYIEFLQMKQNQNLLQMIFPQHNAMRKVIILEDVHKLGAAAPVAKLFNQLMTEFTAAENNQLILATSRGTLDVPVDYWAALNGLSREDKMATLEYHLPQTPKELRFHRATDSVLVFSNILRELIENGAHEKQDPLRLTAQIKHRFENVAGESPREFQARLNEYALHDNLIELVFIVGSGIPYVLLSGLFDPAEIDLLIEQKVFKLSGGKVYPFHDHYTAAYLEGKKMSPQTARSLELLAESNEGDAYIYLASLLKQGNALFFSKIAKARKLRDRYFGLSRLHESYMLAQAIVAHIDFNEPLDIEEVYDVYVLATSAFYTKNCDDIIALYKAVLEQGHPYQSDPKMWGVLLRARTELMNQYYWDLELDKLEAEFQNAEGVFPTGAPSDHEIVRFACIHRFNRRMVFELLIGQYDAAEADYKNCVRESGRLDQIACLGFAEMDYGKGLYLVNADEALAHMERALEIFDEIGTEHRRRLDCACEVAFLRCSISGPDPERLHALESAALALRQNHYEEIYAKAKLKLAALHLCGVTPDLQRAEAEIVEAEYVLSFRPCKRLEMLFANIKHVYYVLKGQKPEAQRELKAHRLLARALSPDYSAIPAENALSRIPSQAAFFRMDCVKSADTVWIDPRIW